MKYIKRYNKFSLQTNCRICLTQTVTTKLSLSAPLKGAGSHKPLVYEALEFLLNEKVPLRTKYPDSICGMCGELLKISYDLVVQYHLSKQKLKKQLRELGEESDSSDVDDRPKVKSPKAPVEIVVGSKRFNINDLVIVEDEKDEPSPFDGFLRNLGHSVSATFVKKGYEKPKPHIEVPSLVIERIVQEQTPEISEKPQIEEIPMANIESPQLNEPLDAVDEVNEDQFIDEPINAEVFESFEILTEKDKDVLESALNLKYKCPHCSKPMASLTRAKLHSRSCTKNCANVNCYVCGASFELRKHLLRHIKQVHLDDLNRSGTLQGRVRGIYTCRICNKSFASNGSLFYHMSKHSGKRYACDKCDKRFYTKTQARNHAQTHSREQTVVVCPICGKGFHYKSGLFYHMKMHTNERNLQCSFCPRRFYTRNSVKRHELTHTGARPYSCQFCEKKFRSLGEVRKHELLHTGERPYQCKYCDMGFTQGHNLKVHLMTHPGEFECLRCSKTFADGDILKFHLRNKHQIETYASVEEDNFEETVERPDESEIQEEMEEESDALADGDDLQLGDHQAFYITEEYEEDEGEQDDEPSELFVKTYELRDEVLVETVENFN